MKLFNALQIVALYTGMPFFISWLGSQTFPFATVGLYAAGVVYFFAFVMLCVCVRNAMDSNGPLG